MHIVADENIPYLQEFFSDFGDISMMPGRDISRAQLEKADALLIRSITPLTQELIADSKVTFIGTATAGTDHVDLIAVNQAGIQFSSAPGSNAFAVTDYILSCLALLEKSGKCSLHDMCVGILGFGEIGRRVKAILDYFKIENVVCDPVLAAEGKSGLISFDEMLAKATIVTIHTPLTVDTLHQTYHLFDEECLMHLAKNAVLINAARGAVIDEKALKSVLSKRDDVTVVLDVFEFEPRVDTSLLDSLFLATPHIAGYSLDGKARGTEMLYVEFCRHFNLPITKARKDFLPELPKRLQDNLPVDSLLTVLDFYDASIDDAIFRKISMVSQAERSKFFDQCRKEYAIRREFSSHIYHLA